jgi:ferredoxin
VSGSASQDDIDQIREWMRATDPEEFGCVCEPAVMCGTCRMRFKHSVLRSILRDTDAALSQQKGGA